MINVDDLDIEALLEAPFIQRLNNFFKEKDSSRSRKRSRSRSPSPTRNPSSSHSHRERVHSPGGYISSPSVLTEAQRDRRTVFCRQLAQRLESRQLKEFCERVGRVRDVRIVYDKISRRSKGVAYVEFCEEESVPLAVALTGQKLLGIPIIVELTETEKNRLAEEAAAALRMEKFGQKFSVASLTISNLSSSIIESDLKRIFQPFGEVVSIQLNREDLSKITANVNFKNESDASQAFDKMNGFELAGKPLKLYLKDQLPANSTRDTENELLDGEDAAADAEMMLRIARDASSLKGLITTRPSSCLLLQHLYDPSLETADGWEVEIAEEVKEECLKFGRVEHLHVPKTADGDVFVRFASVDSAQAAAASLSGRWFGGKQITTSFIPSDAYLSRFPSNN